MMTRTASLPAGSRATFVRTVYNINGIASVRREFCTVDLDEGGRIRLVRENGRTIQVPGYAVVAGWTMATPP